MAWMSVTGSSISVKIKNLAAEKRKQDYRKQQLVKKLKETAAGKDNVRHEGLERSQSRKD